MHKERSRAHGRCNDNGVHIVEVYHYAFQRDTHRDTLTASCRRGESTFENLVTRLFPVMGKYLLGKNEKPLAREEGKRETGTVARKRKTESRVSQSMAILSV